jgi:hypothetical protein
MCDAEKHARDPSTDFDPTVKAPQLSSLDPTNPETVNFDGELINAVRRRKHNANQTRREDPTRRSKPSTSSPPVLAQTLHSRQHPPFPPLHQGDRVRLSPSKIDGFIQNE